LHAAHHYFPRALAKAQVIVMCNQG